MKQTIAAIALSAVALVLCGVILVQVGSITTQRREKEYRIQAAAEQMVHRLYNSADIIADACSRVRSATAACDGQPHVAALIMAQRIDQTAATGDERQLAIEISRMQNIEASTETALKRIVRRK